MFFWNSYPQIGLSYLNFRNKLYTFYSNSPLTNATSEINLNSLAYYQCFGNGT